MDVVEVDSAVPPPAAGMPINGLLQTRGRPWWPAAMMRRVRHHRLVVKLCGPRLSSGLRCAAVFMSWVLLFLIVMGLMMSKAALPSPRSETLTPSPSPPPPSSAGAATTLQQPLALCSSIDGRGAHACKRGHRGVLDVTLELRQHLLLGPGFSVWTRAYNGSVPAPTLRVRAGDTLRIKLVNGLGANSDDPVRYNKVNTTNLHFHGYHGSPKCSDDPSRPRVCSDNVLVEVLPGGEQQYEYHIADDHAPGLFWYHPHAEGSTGVQVGGGAVLP